MTSFHGAGERTSGVGARPATKLLDQVRERMRRLGMSKRSEEAYVGWIRRFILANDKRHPTELGAPEIERFLGMLEREPGQVRFRSGRGRLFVDPAPTHHGRFRFRWQSSGFRESALHQQQRPPVPL